MENALALLPKIVVRDSAVDALCHGANLTAPGVLSVDSGMTKGSVTAIFTLKGEAIALGSSSRLHRRDADLGPWNRRHPQESRDAERNVPEEFGEAASKE